MCGGLLCVVGGLPMEEDELLQSLLLTAVGGILGISGTLIASRWQANEARQERGERYRREDRYRLSKDRLEAYSSFWLAAGEVRSLLGGGPVGEGGISPSEAMSVRNGMFREFVRVALIGDSKHCRRQVRSSNTRQVPPARRSYLGTANGMS
jgi:hypothetical protein